MYLSRIYIENYRSIQKLDMRFTKGKNVIVGKNNAGKSNIIRAIDLILGEKSPTWNKSDNIVENDFFEGDTSNEIFIWCELIKEDNENLDLSEAKGAFFKLTDAFSSQSIKKKIKFSQKDDIFEFCSEEGQARCDDRLYYRKKWVGTRKYCSIDFNQEFAEIDNFAFAFRCKKEDGKYTKEMMLFYKEKTDSDWLFGINANLRNELLQSAIIPSFRDPKDQLRISNYTWYGKLLKQYIRDDSPELNDAFENVKEASNKLFEDLQNEICCERTQIAFPNTKLSFQFNPDTRQDIYKSTLIYVDDGFNSKLDEKGAGIQSSVIIGLFDYYIRNVAHANGSLLAIEEPELYLHPHGKRVISDRLDVFLDDDKNQVIITTHSPEFICCPNEGINIIVVKKDGNKTLAKNFYFEDIKTKQILIKKQNAEMFFADAVIFVEGADKYILEVIAEEYGEQVRINGENGEKSLGRNWLNDYNVSIINCGGKAELWKYAKVFNDLEIPWQIVADFDYLKEGLSDFYTKLSYDQSYINNLNSIKSRAELPKKCKCIDQVDDQHIPDVMNYINQLKNENIFVLTGELENFYIQTPKYSKEQGVLETIENCKTENAKISEYIKKDEFECILNNLIRKCLNEDIINMEDIQ